MDINFDGLGIKFIGYDNNHYSYWDAWTKRNSEDISKYFVLILSKYSEVIFAFYYGQLKDSNYDIQTYPTSGARIAIEPNGDVWFMVGSNKGYDFYKVE